MKTANIRIVDTGSTKLISTAKDKTAVIVFVTRRDLSNILQDMKGLIPLWEAISNSIELMWLAVDQIVLIRPI